MKALKRLFTSGSSSARCRYCDDEFTPEYKHQQCCSSDCLRHYNSRGARDHTRHRHNENHPPPQRVGRSREAPAAHSKHAPGPSVPRYDSHTTRGYPSSSMRAPVQHQSVSAYPATHDRGPGHQPFPRHAAPPTHSSAHPTSHSRNVSFHPDVPQEPHPGNQRRARRSSAGHTPGFALVPLPTIPDDNHDALPAHANERRADRTHRAPRQVQCLPPSSTSHAPSAGVVYPSSAGLRDTAPIQVFSDPRLPPSADGTANKMLWMVDGFPIMNPVVSADGRIVDGGPAGNAAMATFPSSARARELQARPAGFDYGYLAPERAAVPRPNASSRRGPRPRSNSFGGY